MRIQTFILLLSLALVGCSSFERAPEEQSGPPFPPSEVDPLPGSEFVENEEQAPSATENADVPKDAETESAQLQAKIQALETKVSALSSQLEAERARKSQPEIQAEDSAPAVENQNAPLPAENSTLASDNAAVESGSGNAEADFRAAMRLFMAGSYRDSANRFFSVSKNYPQHILASHSLYWAGESGARARNWKIAISHWSNLTERFPRSIYVSEALAGLANAHMAQTDLDESKRYRELLIKAFPDAPATTALLASMANSDNAGEFSETPARTNQE